MTYVALSDAAEIFEMAGVRWECQYPLMECQASEAAGFEISTIEGLKSQSPT